MSDPVSFPGGSPVGWRQRGELGGGLVDFSPGEENLTSISWSHLAGHAGHLKLAVLLLGCFPEQFLGSPPGSPPWQCPCSQVRASLYEGLLALLQLLDIYLQLLTAEVCPPRSP